MIGEIVDSVFKLSHVGKYWLKSKFQVETFQWFNLQCWL